MVAATCIALLVSCSSPPPLLNSERIEQRFGSYGVEVIRADENSRYSSLYSLENSEPVTRTLAVVEFADPMPAPLRAAHQQIVSGESIGATFKAAGWSIDKPLLGYDVLAASPRFEHIYELMGLEEPAPLAVHRYRLQLLQGDEALEYAIISEIHSPAYLTAEEVREIYGQPSSGPTTATAVDALLAPLLEELSSATRSAGG